MNMLKDIWKIIIFGIAFTVFFVKYYVWDETLTSVEDEDIAKSVKTSQVSRTLKIATCKDGFSSLWVSDLTVIDTRILISDGEDEGYFIKVMHPGTVCGFREYTGTKNPSVDYGDWSFLKDNRSLPIILDN